MLNGTLIVIVSDHGGWRNTHDFQFQPFSASVDIPLLIRGEWLTVPSCNSCSRFESIMDDSSYRLNFDLDRKNKIYHYR